MNFNRFVHAHEFESEIILLFEMEGSDQTEITILESIIKEKNKFIRWIGRHDSASINN